MENYLNMNNYKIKRKCLAYVSHLFKNLNLNELSVTLLEENNYLSSYKCLKDSTSEIKRAMVVLGIHYKDRYLMNLELYVNDNQGEELNLFISMKEEYMQFLEIKKIQLSLLMDKARNTSFLFAYKKKKEIKKIIAEKKLFINNELSFIKDIINHSISFFGAYLSKYNKNLKNINSNINDFKKFITEGNVRTSKNVFIYTSDLDDIIDLFDDENLNINIAEDVYFNERIKKGKKCYMKFDNDSTKLNLFKNYAFINELYNRLDMVIRLHRNYSEDNITAYNSLVDNALINPSTVYDFIDFDDIDLLVEEEIKNEEMLTDDVYQDLYELLMTESNLDKFTISFFEFSYKNHYFYNKNIKNYQNILRKSFKENHKNLTIHFEENNQMIISYIELSFAEKVDLFRIDLAEKKIYELDTHLDSNYISYNKAKYYSKFLKDMIFPKELVSFDFVSNEKISFHIEKDNTEMTKFINIEKMK